MARPLAFSPFPAGKGVGGLGPLLTDLALALGVGLVTLACAALLWNPVLMWEQVIGLHAVRETPLDQLVVENAGRIWEKLRREGAGLILLPVLGAGVALARWQLGAVALLAWNVAGVVLLLVYEPLYSHHVATLFPGLAALAGLGAAAVLTSMAGLLRDLRSEGERHRRAARGLVAGVGGVVLLAAVAALPDLVDDQFKLARWELEGSSRIHAGEVEAAAMLAELVPPDRWVVTDTPAIAFQAGRLIPPPLVDNSKARLDRGSLTEEAVIAATEAYRVDYVLLWDDKFRRIPGYERWLKKHFDRVHRWEGGGRLYVRKPSPPS